MDDRSNPDILSVNTYSGFIISNYEYVNSCRISKTWDIIDLKYLEIVVTKTFWKSKFKNHSWAIDLYDCSNFNLNIFKNFW